MKSSRRGIVLPGQRRGTLHNSYLKKSFYFLNNKGTFMNPKSEEQFIQETMFYINLDLFQQTQIIVIILSALKIIPWFHLMDLVNYQDFGLIIFLAIAYLTGRSLRSKKQHHMQRLIIMIVIFFELIIIQFMLLDKDLVDQQLWQVFGQIGIVIQNILVLSTPLQSAGIVVVENFLLKFMLLCRGKDAPIHGCNANQEGSSLQYQSYCHLTNLYTVTIEDFFGSPNNLITVYSLLTLAIYYIINKIMRRYWIFINSFQKSDKSNSHLSQKNMTTFFIIDQNLQFMFFNEKGQQFIRSCEENNERITSFSQLFKTKEQPSIALPRDKNSKGKLAIFKEKMDKEIELEMWLDESLGKGLNSNITSNPTEESIFEQADTVGLTQSDNDQKVFYKLKMGPIMWSNSKMIQIILEKQTKISDIVLINEYFYDLLFKSSSDSISQLERDYLKWYNMVSLNVIKNDDLKELSKCIHEYHQQYIYLYSIRKLNNEFHKIVQQDMNEFNIKANMVQAVEIVLVKKIHLVNQITVQFEDSFPSQNVLADDILFHHMMVSILDLIIQPIEEKPEQKVIDQSFKNSPQIGQISTGEGLQPRQAAAEPTFKKFDFKVDCKLKQIRRSEVLDLSFIFEFHCLPETERLLQKVFKKVRNMDANEFISPEDLLDQGKDYVNLFLIFMQLKRQDGEFELEKKEYHDIIISDQHRDSNDEDGESKTKNENNNVMILSISLSVSPVSMQTFPGKYNSESESLHNLRVNNMGATVTQSMTTTKNQVKNTIRCPAPLNLTFAREPKINKQQTVIVWQQKEGKEAKKPILNKDKKKTGQIYGKMFPNSLGNNRISKLPTNKDFDQQPQLPTSQQNIPAGQQSLCSSVAVNANKAPITNQSSGNNLTPNKKDSEDLSNSCNPIISTQGTGSYGQIQSLSPIPIATMSQQTSIYHRDSVRKQSTLNIDIMKQLDLSSSPKQYAINHSSHHKSKRRTSIVGGFPQQKQFQDEILVTSKIRSLSRQVSQKIQEEINTSEEEEKKDLLLSDHKLSNTNSQYKMPTSSRKICDIPLSLSAQKAQSQQSQTSIQKGNATASFCYFSESKIGSKQQSAEKIHNPNNKSNFEKEDFVKISEFKNDHETQDYQNENDEEDHHVKLIRKIQKQIQETLKQFKPLFVQDASLVVKQILSHSNTFEGQDINVIQACKDSRNSPYLFHGQSSTTATTIGGDDSDTSQPNTQQRKKIARGNGRIKKNTTILDKFAGVNSSSGHSMRKSFKMKIIQQSFNDSPQIDSFTQHTDISNAPSRLSREFDSNLPLIPSQSQMNISALYTKETNNQNKPTAQQELISHLTREGIDFNTDCIYSADEDSRTDSPMTQMTDRKRASTYDIPFYYLQNQMYIDEIKSCHLKSEVNESRSKTHKRQWLTDDVWRKQHYSRSQTVLINTNNQKIVSQLKQLSQVTKKFQDCKHVRFTFSLIKEYQQMMESCNLFLFILIDFQEQPEKAENILQQTVVTIRECEERMGVPKTFIIGYVDFQEQGEFLNKNYDKLDFWLGHETEFNQHTLIEYVDQIKKKEIS